MTHPLMIGYVTPYTSRDFHGVFRLRSHLPGDIPAPSILSGSALPGRLGRLEGEASPSASS